jgi:hypothetical protein
LKSWKEHNVLMAEPDADGTHAMKLPLKEKMIGLR